MKISKNCLILNFIAFKKNNLSYPTLYLMNGIFIRLKTVLCVNSRLLNLIKTYINSSRIFGSLTRKKNSEYRVNLYCKKYKVLKTSVERGSNLC